MPKPETVSNDCIKLRIIETYSNSNTPLSEGKGSSKVEFTATTVLYARRGDIKHVREILNVTTKKPYKTLSGVIMYDGATYVVKAVPTSLWQKATTIPQITVKGFMR